MAKLKRSVIVKVSTSSFKKWEYVDNLVSFTRFLDRDYPGWKYMNVYSRESREQIASYTQRNRPTRHI